MSELYACQKCGGTFLVYEGEKADCAVCGLGLVPVCEWCEKPEKECVCKKDEIETGD